MNRLFDQAAPGRLFVLTLGIGETASILVRRRNSGRMSHAAFAPAYAAMLRDALDSGQLRLYTAVDDLVFTSLPLIEQHPINSTDAMVLRSALDTAAALRNTGHDLVLVASDARLVRAAAAEGLATFNPETDDQAAWML